MIILDTDVLIDFLYQKDPSASFVRRLQEGGETVGTTSINAAELLRGAGHPDAPLPQILRALDALHEVPFGPRAARRFGRIMNALGRAGASISVADGLIAAATLEAGARLATRNGRDFQKVVDLDVVVPG